MHHIALGSIDKQYERKVASLPVRANRVARWMGALGDGEAMLAAGPDADPVATASQALKDNWERGKSDFHADLEKVVVKRVLKSGGY